MFTQLFSTHTQNTAVFVSELKYKEAECGSFKEFVYFHMIERLYD
jgi:hypothetical protein